jgi:hypothetical protein
MPCIHLAVHVGLLFWINTGGLVMAQLVGHTESFVVLTETNLPTLGIIWH